MTITTQQLETINVGSAANDGTGDPLRDAFVKINDNFNYIANTGIDTGNLNVAGDIEVSGAVSAASFNGSGTSIIANITAGNIYTGNVYADYFVLSNGQLPFDNYPLDVKISGNVVIANTYVPTANNSVGSAGQIVWDSSYLYICVATNTWKRANLSAW